MIDKPVTSSRVKREPLLKHRREGTSFLHCHTELSVCALTSSSQCACSNLECGPGIHHTGAKTDLVVVADILLIVH